MSRNQEPEELAALASYLSDRREAILAAWRSAAESDPELSTASTLSRIQFNDHIPAVLDAFCLLYTSPSPRDRQKSRMPSSA